MESLKIDRGFIVSASGHPHSQRWDKLSNNKVVTVELRDSGFEKPGWSAGKAER